MLCHIYGFNDVFRDIKNRFNLLLVSLESSVHRCVSSLFDVDLICVRSAHVRARRTALLLRAGWPSCFLP